jgi:hypothetical protein
MLEKINQDINNLSRRCYNQEKHNNKSKNLSYEHYMNGMESLNIQKCEVNYNQGSTLKDIQTVFCNWEQELACD